METTQERLTAGHAKSEEDARIPWLKRERDELAAIFKIVPSLERLSALRDKDPLAFRQFVFGVQRIQLSEYERQRDAFNKTGDFSDAGIERRAQGFDGLGNSTPKFEPNLRL